MKLATLIAIVGWVVLMADASRSMGGEPQSASGSAGPREVLKTQPRELGKISWGRDFDYTLKAAARKNKPVLVLFDEVPGCQTCVSYGQLVLSHPLIVEAIETLFEPVAVYNNVNGFDAEVLKSFDEPAMNNPVVRIIDANRKPLAPRLHDDYTAAGLVSTMTAALGKTSTKVPGYLKLLDEELTARAGTVQRGVFAMHCFWEGEAKLGGMDGVIETRPGFVQGHEVVEVLFDPKRVSYETLVKKAQEMKCADLVFTQDDGQQAIAKKVVGTKAIPSTEKLRPDDEPKYHMAASLYRFVPMTLTQACRVNAAVAKGENPSQFLSPRQLEIFAKIEAHPQRKWQAAPGTGNLERAWNAALRVAMGR